MCTVSWLPWPAGYHVFFNRDERPDRAAGLPPAPAESKGVRWLGPRDGQQGGAWIGANECGITLALANRYGESPADEPDGGGWTSRGHLVSELLGVRSLARLAPRLGGLPLRVYRPFTLMGFATGEPVLLFAWDGSALAEDALHEPGHVLSSSGHDQAEATRVRTGLFAEAANSGNLTLETMERLHASHAPRRGPLSICMHRPEASTVSFTRVTVRPDRIEVVYTPGPPCVTGDRVAATLPRA